MKHIFDEGFKYTPAAETNIKKTFDKVRKQQQEKARREAEGQSRVAQLPTRRRAP